MDYQGYELASSLGAEVFAVPHCSLDLWEGGVPMLLQAAPQRTYIRLQLCTAISVATSYGGSLEYAGC